MSADAADWIAAVVAQRYPGSSSAVAVDDSRVGTLMHQLARPGAGVVGEPK